jgi:hypothetical protein
MTEPLTWDDISRTRAPLDMISAIAGTPPAEDDELPHGGTIRDLRISIGRLAQKGQNVFARTLLGEPGLADDATFELNHLAHGAAFHGFALVAVLRYLDEYCDPAIAQHAAAMVQEMGVDGDVGEWCEDIAEEISRGPNTNPEGNQPA